MIPAKTLVCAPVNQKLALKLWPNKSLVVSSYCEEKFIYLMKKRGGIIAIKVDDLSIWVPHKFPFFKRKFKGNIK